MGRLESGSGSGVIFAEVLIRNQRERVNEKKRVQSAGKINGLRRARGRKFSWYIELVVRLWEIEEGTGKRSVICQRCLFLFRGVEFP